MKRALLALLLVIPFHSVAVLAQSRGDQKQSESLIYISGEIRNPGSYGWERDMTVRQAIEKPAA